MRDDIISMYNKYIINRLNVLLYITKSKKQEKELGKIYLRTLLNIERAIADDIKFIQKKEANQ